MTRVAVITGAGGMGVPTAELLAADHAVVLADVRQDRLDTAVSALAAKGISATAVLCDVTDRKAVEALFATAAGLGTVDAVVHTAGVSPNMGDAGYVMRTNALGTLNVNEVFHGSAAEGAAIVNVASMASYLMPDEMLPTQHFDLAFTDEKRFIAELLAVCELAPAELQSGMAYGVSKNFVRWYTTSQTERFTGRGLRIVSVSPGSVDTEMGRLEESSGSGAIVANAAVPRWGTAQEMADLFAFCVSDRAGYLTGTDILNDGGVIASIRERARKAGKGEGWS